MIKPWMAAIWKLRKYLEIMILSGGINFMARRVTEEEFYNIIDKLDVTVTLNGNFPYFADFCLVFGGKRVGYSKPVNGVDEYYLED